MKWLILLSLLFLIVAIFASRYRRQIGAARKIWGALKNRESIEGSSKETGGRDIQLIKCGACGNWTPRSNGLRVGDSSFYCSTDCLKIGSKSAVKNS